MTKKDYELLADVFSKCLQVERDMIKDKSPNGGEIAYKAVKFTVTTLSYALAAQDKRFKRERFLEECGVID